MHRFALILLVLFISSLAFAQDGVTRGDALRRREYQTYAPVNLFVDPTGNDTNACTAAGTSACASISGALFKLPRFIRHAVSIAVAAGAYSTSFNVQDLSLDPNVTMTIDGDTVLAALSTGTPTGTFTAVTLNTAASLATLTDTGQSWTVNELQGLFVVVSGQTLPIVSNTATTISVNVATGVTPGAYEIRRPGPVITVVSTVNIRNVTTPSPFNTFVIRDLEIVSSSANPITFSGTARAQLINNRVRRIGVGTAISSTFFSGSVSMSNNYIESAGTGGTVLFTATDIGPRLSLSGNFIRNTSTGPAFTGALAGSQLLSTTFWSATTAGPVVSGLNPILNISSQNPNCYIQCTAGASTNVGLRVNNPNSDTVAAFGGALTFNGNMQVLNCATGVEANGPTRLNIQGSNFTGTTTAISVNQGAVIGFIGSTPAFSGVSNELLLDGSPYPFATLSALPVPAFIANAQGSVIYR
jgi:hypothetical protein